MAEPNDDEERALEQASHALGQAIWKNIVLAQDEQKARGLIGRAERKRLVDEILKLARLLRRGK